MSERGRSRNRSKGQGQSSQIRSTNADAMDNCPCCRLKLQGDGNTAEMQKALDPGSSAVKIPGPIPSKNLADNNVQVQVEDDHPPEANNVAANGRAEMNVRLHLTFGEGYGYYAVIIVFAAISIGAIVIGAIFAKASNCPGKPNMASVLIVTGSIGALFCILRMSGRLNIFNHLDRFLPESLMRHKSKYYCVLNVSLLVAEIIAYIHLAVMLGSLYPKVKYTPGDRNEQGQMDTGDVYCNQILFLFTMYSTSLVMGIMGFVVFVLCCVCGFLCCLGRVRLTQ